MKSKSLSFRFLFLLVFSLVLVSAHQALAFDDTAGTLNETAIEYLAERGVVEGYEDGAYRPLNPVNRAEFTKILIESKFPKQAAGIYCFPDVESQWFSKYVCYAQDLDIINGYPDGYFRPENSINLAEALKIVLETYGIEVCHDCYSQWYEPYFWKAKESDILDRVTQDVEEKITRGEMAQLIYNTEQFLGLLTPAPSPEIPAPSLNPQEDQDASEEEPSQTSEVNPDDLTFPEGGEIKSIPNIAILEYPVDSPWRSQNTGNLNLEKVLQDFYAEHEDEFDMIISMNIGSYEGQYNDFSNGKIHRYNPANTGIIEICGTVEDPNCENKPDRLRFAQVIGHFWLDSNSYLPFATSAMHEIAHYWGVRWQEAKSDQCSDEWANQAMENGHWSTVFQAGGNNFWSYGNPSDYGATRHSLWVDNKDGTFTLFKDHNNRFNYMDLYAMGLMSEEELATKEMYVILNPILIGGSYAKGKIYSGIRHDVTLDDFKNTLKQKEDCPALYEEGDFYTGDGSRIPHERDSEKELAEEFRVAFVFIKHPEQKISYQNAYSACQFVNYTLPQEWHEVTWRRSTLNTYFSEDTKNPDCEALFAN